MRKHDVQCERKPEVSVVFFFLLSANPTLDVCKVTRSLLTEPSFQISSLYFVLGDTEKNVEPVTKSAEPFTRTVEPFSLTKCRYFCSVVKYIFNR